MREVADDLTTPGGRFKDDTPKDGDVRWLAEKLQEMKERAKKSQHPPTLGRVEELER